MKLAPELVPHHRARGELSFAVRLWSPRASTRIMMAQLMAGDRYTLPVLDQAVIREINCKGGILISGTEVIPLRNTTKSRVTHFAQTWWCVPAHLSKPVEPDARIARALASALGHSMCAEDGADDDDDALALVRPEHLKRKYPGLA